MRASRILPRHGPLPEGAMKLFGPQDASSCLIEQRQRPMKIEVLQTFTPPAGAGEGILPKLCRS